MFTGINRVKEGIASCSGWLAARSRSLIRHHRRNRRACLRQTSMTVVANSPASHVRHSNDNRNFDSLAMIKIANAYEPERCVFRRVEILKVRLIDLS